MTPLIAGFWKAYESGADVADTAAALSSYFGDMAAAPGQLQAGMDDAAFLAEAQPWLNKLGLYGRAGQAAVDLLVARRSGDWRTFRRDSLRLAQLRNQVAAMPQVVAPGVLDAFIARAGSASS
jgi:hypothetical protein